MVPAPLARAAALVEGLGEVGQLGGRMPGGELERLVEQRSGAGDEPALDMTAAAIAAAGANSMPARPAA